MNPTVTEDLLWHWVNTHPRFWLIGATLGAFIAFRIFRMAPAETLIGRTAKVILLIACGLFAASGGPVIGLPGNTAFGLFAPTALLVGVWLVVEQNIGLCIKAGKIKPLAAFFHRRTSDKGILHQ